MSEFNCKFCNYFTNNKKDYNKHLITTKHIKNISNNPSEMLSSKKEYKCICGKSYNHRQNLYAHRKKCNELLKNDKEYYMKMINKMENKNNDLKQMLINQDKILSDILKKILE